MSEYTIEMDLLENWWRTPEQDLRAKLNSAASSVKKVIAVSSAAEGGVGK